jgi:membrane fusion protein, adhesin transport system
MSSPVEPRITSVSADLMEPPSRLSGLVIKTVALAIGTSILWSYFTPVAEVAAGTGKVIPDRHVQAIQSVEGGYVVAIYAKSGDFVEKDELIIRLDPTASGTSREEISQQLEGLQATAARLKAHLNDTELTFPEKLQRQNPGAISAAKAQYTADRAELASAMSSYASGIEQKKSELIEAKSQLKTVDEGLRLASEEFTALRKLKVAGAASRAEVMASENRHNELNGLRNRIKLSLPRLQAGVDELTTRREERANSFKAKVAAELNDIEIKISSFTASLQGQQSRVERTEIRAPVSGILKTVNATNIGQVIKPYDAVAEIVPDSETVLVQARIRPEDIGFIAKGLPAVIKLSAYDYSIFGSLHGTLERIAADSSTDERGVVYYAVDVRADKSFIERRGERWPVKPGMVASVEIITGTRTVFQYLTKPIHRMATMALRER